MKLAAGKYCINCYASCIHKDCFLKGNVRVNTLVQKAFFLKLNIDTPLVSNFSKTATSFLHS